MNAHQEPRQTSIEPLDHDEVIDDRLPAVRAPGYEATTTRITAGGTLPIFDEEWVGALIVVTDGSIALECSSGATPTVPAGSILWFSGLGLRAVHNNDIASATIVSTRRSTSHRHQ